VVNRLDVEIQRPNGGPVVIAQLVGELDLATVGEAGPQVLAAAGDDSLVVDLAGLTFLDSAAVHLLFRLVRRFEERGRLLAFVVPAESAASRVIEIIDLRAAAPVVPTRDEALELVGDRAGS
jgi:anti-anti-sigma factor